MRKRSSTKEDGKHKKEKERKMENKLSTSFRDKVSYYFGL